MNEERSMDQFTFPAGSVIHYMGLPFRLCGPTVVWGLKENFDVAMSSQYANSADQPDPATHSVAIPSEAR
jgi:hypothetical protein